MRKVSYAKLIIWITILFSLLVTSVTGIVFYRSINAYSRQKNTDIATTLIVQAAQRVDGQLSQVESAVAAVQTHGELLTLVDQLRNPRSTYQRMSARLGIHQILTHVRAKAEMTHAFYLALESDTFSIGYSAGQMLGDWDALKDAPALRPVWEEAGRIFMLSADQLWPDGRADDLLYASCLVRGDVPYGLLLVSVKEEWLPPLLMREGFALAREGRVLYNDTGLADSMLLEAVAQPERHRDIFTQALPRNGLTLLFAQASVEGGELARVSNYIIVFFCLNVLLMLILARHAMQRICAPIDSLSRMVSDYNLGAAATGPAYTPSEHRSLRELVLRNTLLVVLPPLILFVGLYFVSSMRGVQDNLQTARMETIERTATDLQTYFQDKQSLVRNIALDEQVQRFLVDDSADERAMEERVALYIKLANASDNVRLYDVNQQLRYASGLRAQADDAALLAALKDEVAGFCWGDVRRSYGNRQEYGIGFVVRGVYLPGEYQRQVDTVIGYLVIGVAEDELAERYRSVAALNDTDFWVVDAGGQIISSQDRTQLGTQLPALGQDRTQTHHAVQLGRLPLWLHGTYGSDAVIQEALGLFQGQWLWIVLVLLAIVLFAYGVSELVTRPVSVMGRLLERMGLFTLEPLFPENSFISEVDQLGKAFNDMTLRLEGLLDELLVSRMIRDRLEVEKREAELDSLQSQIKPHFLCNTLDSIGALIQEGRGEEGVSMLNDLGSLFRYGISQPELIVGVAQELAYTQAYLNIMQRRFAGRIECDFVIRPEALERTTLRMILQPLVENSIEHGLEVGCVRIVITAFVREDTLVFRVEDDGIGMTGERLDEVLRGEAGTVGMGIANVRKRLSLCYDQLAAFELTSSPGQGTRVEIAIKALDI